MPPHHSLGISVEKLQQPEQRSAPTAIRRVQVRHVEPPAATPAKISARARRVRSSPRTYRGEAIIGLVEAGAVLFPYRNGGTSWTRTFPNWEGSVRASC